jgi:hypothetical protein
MWNLSLKIEYAILTLLVLIMIISIWQYNYILADSPSFYRLYVGDDAPSTSPVSLHPNATNSISSTSYTSDGRTLRATIWLISRLYGNLSYTGMKYGIKVFLPNETNPSYDVYIQQQKNSTWMTNVVEYPPFQHLQQNFCKPSGEEQPLIFKPLEKERMYPLSNKGSMYINLSLDLATIGYPYKYHMCSYVESNKAILDTTYPIFVPPTPSTRCGLKCVVPRWPNPIQEFPGKSDIPITISSNDLINDLYHAYNERYNVSLVENKHDTHLITLSFSPGNISLPVNGSNKWQLHITTQNYIPFRNYSMLINEGFTPLSGPFSGITIPLKNDVLNIEIQKPDLIKQLEQKFSEPILQFLFGNTEKQVLSYLLIITLCMCIPLLYVIWRRRIRTLMDLGKKDILQINATVMVGVLILLTLGTAVLKHLNTTLISLITASIIFPFAVSSIMVVISKAPVNGHKQQQQGKTYSGKDSDPYIGLKLLPAGIMAMIVGFLYIIAAVVTLAFIG